MAARVTIRFYRREGRSPAQDTLGLPQGCEFKSWRPGEGGLPPGGPHRGENLIWFAFDRLGVFACGAFEELTVWRGGLLLHRLIVTPRWRRFPFMGPDDLQIGGLWTAPESRRIGLATAAIAEAHRRHAASGRRFWFLVDDDNVASIGLAETTGYRLVGTGGRTRPLGVSALGRFRMDSATATGGG